MGEDAERAATLDRDLYEVTRRHEGGENATVVDRGYVLATARKRR